MNPKIILAIETSCDETAISIVQCSGSIDTSTNDTANALQTTVLSEALYSQIAVHAPYGGVFPALAKREHAKNLVPLLEQVLKKWGAGNSGGTTVALTLDQENKIKKYCAHEPDMANMLISFFESHTAVPPIDYIAVTYGPGLEPALWVGLSFAKVLQMMWNIPALAVNHMEGHIASVLTEAKTISLPAIALLISGGHTELILIEKWGEYKIVGQTRDDAVGEAYDKVARILDLPYPGGPEIARLAEKARAEMNAKPAQAANLFTLPRPMINTHDFDFSFSGLKTAVLYAARDYITTQKDRVNVDQAWKQSLAFEFEEAVTDVLVHKTESAIYHFGAQSLIVGGGVIANTYIRSRLEKLAASYHIPEKKLATDNATMIAFAAYLNIQTETTVPLTEQTRAEGNLSFGNKP